MKISQVEKRTGLRATAIRYYESMGIPRPPRLPNGYRNYTEETVETLAASGKCGSWGFRWPTSGSGWTAWCRGKI